ncbi:MAG: SpoIID/LytB domain-containing protein [Clostridia bacterium]|nr:SpoIID/LytB domain-containing protein [Clostridia bacterium]
MKKRLMAWILSIALVCVSGAMPVFAYDTFEYIKVGLDFGSASVNEFSAKTEQNIVVGYATDRVFTQLMALEGSDVLVEKGGGTYLMTQYDYPTFAEALAGSKILRNQGLEAHAACINGVNKVLLGLYADAATAEAAKPTVEATLGFAFDVVYLDMKTVMVNAGYNYIVFRHDSNIFAFGSDNFGTTKVNGRSYRGYILADRVNSSAIAIVNLVHFDDYTASVVGSEMYSTWPIEALKAQAVIARTYATTVKSYKNYGIDVTDDTRTQAYNGISNEKASTRQAAQETTGILVMYKGKPAQTYFTASSGGKTADVYSAWGGGAGLDYLKSVPDTYENTEKIPNGVWSVSYTAAEIEQKLAAKGVNIGNITNIYVSDRGADERVRQLTFVGTAGTHSVKFESCRTLLSLKSQYYYIQSPSSNMFIISGTGVQNVSGTAYVLGASGTKAVGQTAYVLGADGTQQVALGGGSDYVFDGRGHGHGIGLSQYGAKGMAEAGFNFREIIAHYYPGTTLSK